MAVVGIALVPERGNVISHTRIKQTPDGARHLWVYQFQSNDWVIFSPNGEYRFHPEYGERITDEIMCQLGWPEAQWPS